MIKYGVSRYEEIIKKYKNKEETNYQIEENELYIIDYTGLHIDENLNFNRLDEAEIIDIETNLFDKVTVTIDCNKLFGYTSHIQLEFEDIMTCNVYKPRVKVSVEFICLQEGFRLEFIEKKKNNKLKNTNYFEIEAKFLTIKNIECKEFLENKLNHKKNEIYDYDEINRKKTLKNLHTRWKLGYRDANEAINKVENGETPYYIGENINLEELDISKYLRYFLEELVLTETTIYKYGKTYKNDEFF